MKKILVTMLCLTLLCGCQSNKIDINEERAQVYASYITAIQDNENFMEESSYFDISTAMNKISENEYRWDVIIDSPKVAMYEIQILAVERNVIGTLRDDKIMPSFGILEEEVYNMIPNQVDLNKGYVEGFILSGMTELPEVTIEVMVVWTGYAKLAQNREFFYLHAKYEEPKQ